MIRVDDPALYAESLAALSRFTAGSYYGRLVQIFLACKHYGRLVPQIGTPPGIDSNTFQRFLDNLYEKPNRLPNASVVSLFNNNHLVRTGRQGGSTTTASNIWRNNFNFQKGFCCYGRPHELQNRTFRTQSRTMCPHLAPSVSGQLAGASCALDAAATKARYRNEDHPKVFRIDPTTREHFVYDPSDVSHYAPLVLAPGGRRLPIAPLIVALYFDSPLTAGRNAVEVTDFLADFDFTPAEFSSYFDDDPALAEHAALITAFPRRLSWTRVTSSTVVLPPAPLPAIPTAAVPTSRSRRAAPPSSVSSTVSPPAGSRWWDAEQAVQQLLVASGWMVVNKTRFGVGYDLLAYKAGTTRHVEVKSSAGLCNPALTENEYSEACRLRTGYVLAIVENFDPAKPVVVRWIHDPAQIRVTARQTKLYSLPRSKWAPHSDNSLR